MFVFVVLAVEIGGSRASSVARGGALLCAGLAGVELTRHCVLRVLCSAAVLLLGGGVTTGTTLGASLETGETPVLSSSSHSVWYLLTPTATGPYRISTANSNFDTAIALYSDPSGTLASLTWVRGPP